jgi:hypothetical protein
MSLKIENIGKRASFARKEDELSLVIASSEDKRKAKIIGAILFLWLLGGAYVIYSYFGLTAQNAKIMTLVWLGFWVYFAYIMGKAFLWQWGGREIIKVREGKFYYKRDVNGRGWVHHYPVDVISKMRPTEDKTPSWISKFGGDYWSVDCDSMSFPYQGKEITFGYRLTDTEKEKIRKLLIKEVK